ncbi:MAG: hypothetical protein IPI00_18370 [Flavobacteriales bacterium]|nr:hypothetical protein [Flavobacteriales bacterium]MBK6944391.1 hypothetical protein [Flavobacteriales bacterium]MBK7242064.1 hypothetical protein [Flavobacteriales bacterium]MBP9137473.1 hypothetical protein [Flavobacteriales bacterium]HQV51979.1 alpha-2-macroglobulin family protein [Flavobacteriales bacterium]
MIAISAFLMTCDLIRNNVHTANIEPTDPRWTVIDSLTKIGQYASALEQVNGLLADAQDRNDWRTEFKAWMYRGTFEQRTGVEKTVWLNALEERSAQANVPLKQVLHSVIGESYWNLYQQSRWQVLQRTDLASSEDVAESDPSTWTQRQFMSKVIAEYAASVEPYDTLKQIPSAGLGELLGNEHGAIELRPTVYDLLGRRAIEVFSNSETRLTEPEWRFKLDDPFYFELFEAFAWKKITHRDSASWEYKALITYQQLERSHLADDAPVALTDIILDRLSFVREHSTLADKDSLYYKALSILQSRLVRLPAYSEVGVAMAAWHSEQAGNYQRLVGDAFKEERIKARTLCDSAIAKFPGSYGAIKAAVLKAQLERPSLQLFAEEAVPGNAGSTIAVQHTNVMKLWLRVVMDPQDINEDQRYDHDRGAQLASKKPMREWSVVVPDDGDMNAHLTELPTEGLPYGRYAILISDSERFKAEHDLLVFANFWSTDIAIVDRYHGNDLDLLVLDRTTGKPIKGAKAWAYVRNQDHSGNRRFIGVEEFTTSEEGMVRTTLKGQQGQLKWSISNGNDKFHTASRWVHMDHYEEQEGSLHTFMFTDRAIYRPGQEVLFKGIVTAKNGKNTAVKAGYATQVEFFDVNGELVDTLNVTTDEYGSFHGSFRTPQGVLTGGMHIEEEHGSAYFQVEEYKRPTFEVLFDPITDTPKLNAEATVTGVAKSYAGVPLDGAAVQWTVKRGARMPWWCGWGWRGLPWGRETQLASGIAECDAEGKFIIKFIAQPDRMFPRDADPTFFYTVEASAVDINGETQTSTTTINVAYRSVDIVINGGDAIDRSITDSLDVRVKNLNGQDVDLPMDIKIVELQAPVEAPFRDRLWEQPDRFLPGQNNLTQEDPMNWPMKRVHFEQAGIRANMKATFLPELDAWTVGLYRVDVSTKDPDGVPVTVSKLITIYDPTIQNTGFVNEAFHLQSLKTSVEPGESGVILISSALDECRVLMEVERDGKIVVNRRIRLTKGQQRLDIPALESDRGGFAVHFVCVERGRQHTSTEWIDVPWSNKELNVEWQTFRDKLLPGQGEEWRLKITGPKKEKVAAQLLTVMYDASLDHFVPQNWNLSIWQSNSALLGWSHAEPFGQAYGQEVYRNYAGAADTMRSYPYLETFGMGSYRGNLEYLTGGSRGVVMHRNTRMDADAPAPGLFAEDERSIVASPAFYDAGVGGLTEQRLDKDPELKPISEAPVQQPLRSDFRETAFFFPDLLTDRDGSIVLKFKTPDALTRWKVLGLAHTPDLKIANFSKETITQKPLMVVPNLPRFLRVGDRITLTAKVNVIEGDEVLGEATLELFDPLTNRTVTKEFGVSDAVRNFSAGPGKSASLEWEITVPETWSVVGIRISATNGEIGDGEERVLPILTDKVFVTESLPISITKAGTKTFTLDKLKNTTSTTLKHQNLKLEFTPNPAWYAVQALPYMMEFPHACAEQTFSRYYANRLAGHIVEERPVIKKVFEAWKEQAEANANEGAFLSALEKNPELKTAVLEETPWVLNANNVTERKRRIALFFDLQRMGSEEAVALKKLEDTQLSSGAWPWWSGMRESRYITQHIVAGFGHLETLNASDLRGEGPAQQMLQKAVQWLDADVDRAYKELVQRNSAEALQKYEPSILDIHMLYTRSFFERWPITGGTNTAIEFYKKRLAATWLKNGFQGQAMAALALDRMGDHATAELIMISLSQRATRNEELGMYWKEFNAGYSWNEFPTETHALMIEAFHEVTKDDQSVDALRQYLLKLKQTTDWKTTKATAEACYALLLTGNDLLEPKSQPVIKVGTELVRADAQEAGTGYFTQSWSGGNVKPEMGAVTITTSEDGVQWGALHWQYLEQMDKVTPHDSPFVINKKVMLHEQTENGPQLIALDKARNLEPGDLLTIRIELKTDRYVDYVHLKDLRAAGLEPTEAISGYNYQGGLGYYQSIRDVAMHFFFDRISPGTYVFEYDLRVTHAGDFSNGITTVMCMYAPEFSSHSEGVRVAVEE